MSEEALRVALREEYARTAEYSVWLLELNTQEGREHSGDEMPTSKEIDKKLVRLRKRMEPSEVAEAERVVNIVYANRRAVAGR